MKIILVEPQTSRSSSHISLPCKPYLTPVLCHLWEAD